MGIFKAENMIQGGVDYAAALEKIQTHIKENDAKKGNDSGQIDSSTQEKEKKEKENGKSGLEFDENDDLYNQVIDDECNIVQMNNKVESAYETEYNEVIVIMSKLCRNIVWNNQAANKDRKLKIDETEIIELAPRIWALTKEYDK